MAQAAPISGFPADCGGFTRCACRSRHGGFRWGWGHHARERRGPPADHPYGLHRRPREMAQRPYGARAREALQQLAPVGSEVALQIQTRDRCGRSVAEVFRGGENLNLAMVRKGAAFAFRKYLGQCNSLRYLSTESEAEFRRAGVWATPGGITRPWDWRAESRGNTPAPAPRPPKGQASGGSGVMTGGGGSSGGVGRYYCKNLSKQEAQRLLSLGHEFLDRDGYEYACKKART